MERIKRFRDNGYTTIHLFGNWYPFFAACKKEDQRPWVTAWLWGSKPVLME